jgi:hypothetical protein
MKRSLFIGILLMIFLTIVSIGDFGSLVLNQGHNVGRLPGFEAPIVITGLFVLVAYAAYQRQE